MEKQRIVVIGASAGGINAILTLLQTLPNDLDASYFIVVHLSPFTKSFLPDIFNRAGALKVVHPADGEPIKKGVVYVALPDHHLLIDKGQVLVKKGPKENRFRPSIDALFRSAAYTYGPQCIAIVLSGMLDDGTSGMWTIQHFGGVCIIQDPADALFPSMPEHVLEYSDVDYSVPVSEMGALLARLIGEKPASKKPKVAERDKKRIEAEIKVAAQSNSFEQGMLSMGEPTSLTCPECNGILVNIKEGKNIRYRCHTGHSFTANALLNGVTKAVEDDLWKVVRGMEESVILLEDMARNAKDLGNHTAAKEFTKKADEIRQRSKQIHTSIFKQERIGEEQLVHNKGNGKKVAGVKK